MPRFELRLTRQVCSQIDAKRSVPQELRPRSKKIFVGGLAPDTTDGTPKALLHLELGTGHWTVLALPNFGTDNMGSLPCLHTLISQCGLQLNLRRTLRRLVQ